MRLLGTFAFTVCALIGNAGAAEVNTAKTAAHHTLSMDTWYRVGITITQENALKNEVARIDTAPTTEKLVFNLRRH